MPLTSCPMCNRNGCDQPADGMLAIEFYPPAAVLRHYRTTRPLTHVVIGLELCAKHAAEVNAVTFLGDNMAPLVETVQRATGTAVDVESSRAVLLPFDHPDVVRLRAASSTAKED